LSSASMSPGRGAERVREEKSKRASLCLSMANYEFS
jgi:hypothetical protein